MEVAVFKDEKYAKLKSNLLIYDGTWGSFRPIIKVGWDGKRFVVEDSVFKKDLFSPFYGYGSQEMKTLCESLNEQGETLIAETILDPIVFWRWCSASDIKWFKDRPAVFVQTCNNLDWHTYLSYIGSKHKTLRHAPRGRMTRRLVRK